MIWVAFFIGVFIGANVGIIILGLCVAARDDETIREAENS